MDIDNNSNSDPYMFIKLENTKIYDSINYKEDDKS